MKKPYMCTIKGSSGRDCVLITLLQLYSSRGWLVEGDLFWVVHYDHPPSPPPTPTFVFEGFIQYKYNLMQFLSNLSKLIPSQKTADIII